MEALFGDTHALAQMSEWLAAYGPWAVFFSTICIGEAAIIPFFVLASQGLIEFPTVFAFSTAATLLTDTFWFCVGRLARRSAFFHNYYELKLSPRARGVFEKLFGKHVLLSMVLMKFMYGFRLVNLMWLGFRRFNVLQFLLYDIPACATYIFALLVLGVLIGSGLALTASTLQLAITAAFSFLCLFLLYKGIALFVTKAS